MRILIGANAPWTSVAYGLMGRQMARRLKDAGHDVGLFCIYGLEGGNLETPYGIPLFAKGYLPWGMDVIGAHATAFKADVVLTIHDIYHLPKDYRERIGRPWIAWFPVDREPAPPRTVEAARMVDYPLVYSQFGVRALADAGVASEYVPIGVDTDLYQPGDQAAARKALGLPADGTIFGMVGSNNTFPSRKGYPETLQAFAQFVEERPERNPYLYIHADHTPAEGGINLDAVVKALGIGERVFFVDRYNYMMGLPEAYMADVYQAIDVLLAPSMWEGFGIPIVEAQSCGTPVITTDFTSMPELVHYGLALEPVQLTWDMADAWAAIPSVAGILNAMKKICFMAPSDAQRQEAHAWVHDSFNWDVTFEQYWLPLLERVGRGFGGVHQVVSVGGLTLDLLDADYGDIAKLVAPEATEHYGLDVIPFEPGDVVLDIGAHVGTMSIYLAKRYPGLRILAFEPIRDNYDRLLRNIEANGVGASVTAINLAVTADGRTLTLSADRRNTGSASAYANTGVDGHGWTQMADSTTLADIWADYGLDRVRLLKIDCEGCEYEILQYAGDRLARVDYLSGEFHYNLALTDWEWKPDKLLESCYQFLPAEKVHVTTCRIED